MKNPEEIVKYHLNMYLAILSYQKKQMEALQEFKNEISLEINKIVEKMEKINDKHNKLKQT
jgi:hypothetical protein